MIRRRDFITLLGGAAAWPLAVRAQQGGRVRRIGVLMSGDENDPEQMRRLSAFTQALADLGWSDGRNVRMEVRWFGDDINRIRALAQELVGLRPDIIVTSTTPPTVATLCFILVFDFGKLTTELLPQPIDAVSPALTPPYDGCLNQQTLPTPGGP